MKNRIILTLAAVLCIAFLSACGSNASEGGNSSTAAGSGTEQNTDNSNNDTSESQDTTNDNSANVTWTSPLGYTITYDTTVMTLDDTTSGLDTYTYHSADPLDASVYCSIQAYDDMDARTVADGLALQSGLDGVNVESAYFGADGIDTYSVHYEKEDNGVTRAFGFYAIPKGEGSLLVEYTSYVGVPEEVDWKMEELLGSFSLTQAS